MPVPALAPLRRATPTLLVLPPSGALHPGAITAAVARCERTIGQPPAGIVLLTPRPQLWETLELRAVGLTTPVGPWAVVQPIFAVDHDALAAHIDGAPCDVVLQGPGRIPAAVEDVLRLRPGCLILCSTPEESDAASLDFVGVARRWTCAAGPVDGNAPRCLALQGGVGGWQWAWWRVPCAAQPPARPSGYPLPNTSALDR